MCRILLGRISCRVTKKTFVVEYGLYLGFEKGEELVCSYRSFESNIYDKLDGKKTESERNDGKK